MLLNYELLKSKSVESATSGGGGAERTSAPFFLWPLDMKEHIMAEIRGNYTGSAL